MLKPFQDIIREYQSQGVVFQSPPKQNAVCYCIQDVDDSGFTVLHPQSGEMARGRFDAIPALLSRIQQLGGKLPVSELDPNPLLQSAYLQAAEFGVSTDRKSVLDLSSDRLAQQHFGELFRQLNVNKVGQNRKLYKPVLILCVLEAIAKGELTQNRIEFDWILPRFLEQFRKLSIPATELNAAEGFFHLTGDQFWMLAYREPLRFFRSTPTTAQLRQSVTHATVKETYWRLFSHIGTVRDLQTQLAVDWFPTSGLRMKINLKVLDKAVEQTIRPFLIDQKRLFDTKWEGFIRAILLPKIQPLLQQNALASDAASNLSKALKANKHLLFRTELFNAERFLAAVDSQELTTRILQLLYGEAPLDERVRNFWEWSRIKKDAEGNPIGIDATVISYFLSLAKPKQYAFVKPAVCKAAMAALLGNGSESQTERVDRLAFASQFYDEALKLFQQRYQLPFEDLLDVHTAFYVMQKPYHGLPGWNGQVSNTEGDIVQHELNTILYGPPGTGKTYHTAFLAVEICDGVASADRAELMLRFQELREQKRIEFVTFHQSYGYEDFVEGIRPVLFDGDESNLTQKTGEVRYECRPGIFKRICSLAKSRMVSPQVETEVNLDDVTIWKMSLGDTLSHEGTEIYEECIKSGCILLGYGESTDFTNCNNRPEIFAAAKRDNPDVKPSDYVVTAMDAFRLRMKVGDLVLITDGNLQFRAIGRITGNYEFLTQPKTRMQQSRSVQWLRVLDESLPYELINTKKFSQATIYELDPKNLKLAGLREILGQAEGDDDVSVHRPLPHVLIIDEINRGNIAKILGELITALEPDKRLGAENELKVTLPYSGEEFAVPANLYLIGTMNTADRSIAFLDVALRRRFQFTEMMPDTSLIRALVGENGVVEDVDVAQMVETLNARIELLYDRDHQIGHAFFLGIQTLPDLRHVICRKVIPLLQEYFYGDWSKVCAVLGCPFDESGKILGANPSPLIATEVLHFEKLLGKEVDLVDSKLRCGVSQSFLSASDADELRTYFTAIFGSNPET